MSPSHRLGLIGALLAALPGACGRPAQDTAERTTLQQAGPSRAGHYAIRLAPGADPRRELEQFARDHNLHAAAVVSATGSLSVAMIRMAGEQTAQRLEGPLEIVSLSGTLSPDGGHLHIAVSDRTGHTTGGHLLEGSSIFTTLEVILVELSDLRFSREQDARTGYKELRIAPR